MAAAGGLVLAACGSGHPVSAPPPTTARPASPATTAKPAGVFPLTGQTVYNPALLHRPALSIKVDNAPPARPQSGLNAADIVTEELVEGGMTRFFVTFQSQDAAAVGPIRSARPVDADLLQELGGGIFAYSGAALGEIAPVKAHSGALLLSNDAGDPGFQRVPGRPSPYNLYASTTALYQVGGQRSAHLGAPPQLFTYNATLPAGAVPGLSANLVFSRFTASQWTWDPPSAVYHRAQNGVAANLADGTNIVADNVVILQVAIQGTGIFDQAHNEDPFVVVTGSGTAWVLRGGMMIAGRWERATPDVPLRLIGADGSTIPLHPGRTWLELLPRPATPAFG